MPRNPTIRWSLAFTVVCCGLLALAGCGPPRAGVKGALVLPQGVALQDDDSVQISFHPTEPNEVGAGLAQYNAADKTFVAKSPDGKGLPPGKYKISVVVQPYPGSKTDQRRADDLRNMNSFFSPDATKLTYDVTDARSQSITVDLGKGVVTAAK
jgi:hypothetical protein